MAAVATRRDPYTGDKKKSVREGTGSYEYDNKFFKYEGQWKNGKKHGHGKLVFLDGSYYEGTFNMGEIDGFGLRYFAATGCKYQGQFQRGELQGKGRMIWPDGSVYEGQWENNRRQGFGVMKSIKENLIYKGGYYQNKRQGQGTMIYPKGDRYDGDWYMGKRHGDGDMKYMDGTVYEGQFEDDSFNGQGLMRHCSGVIYHGHWRDGAPTLLPAKLVIVNPTGKEPMEIIQGHPFSITVQCVNDLGEVVEVDSGRELKITAGFKHVKAKKGTALFDLIEEYEEKPIQTPYYEVLQYPLTDYIKEEELTTLDEEDGKNDTGKDGETDGMLQDATERHLSEVSEGTSQDLTSADGIPMRKQSNATADSVDAEDSKTMLGNLKEQPVEVSNTETASVEKKEETVECKSEATVRSELTTHEGQLRRRDSSLSEMSETPISMASTMTPNAYEAPLDAAPFLPPVLNKRSEKGECEWSNIQLAQAPPRFPPFVALDEEEKKVRARQNKQVEAKRLSRAMHDERFARVGEYVIMVTDVTSPPFMDKTLEPAYLLVKLKKPKKEKKQKETKPKSNKSKEVILKIDNPSFNFTVLVRTASMRRFQRVPPIYVLNQNKKNKMGHVKTHNRLNDEIIGELGRVGRKEV